MSNWNLIVSTIVEINLGDLMKTKDFFRKNIAWQTLFFKRIIFIKEFMIPFRIANCKFNVFTNNLFSGYKYQTAEFTEMNNSYFQLIYVNNTS